jgi:UDP-GlcNAc:undecaprenyl-phosphate/decaprenyl-phosphate GlcNAc-1-phosphate transferase
MSVVLGLYFAVLLTPLLVPPLIRIAQRVGMVDRPNPRKAHSQVIPRCGGVAVLLGALIPFAFLIGIDPFLTGALLGGLVILVIGVLDDLMDLDWRWKLAGQVAASGLALYASGLHFDRYIETWPGYLLDFELVGFPLTVLFLVACINSINLADGLDGLAGGMCLLIFASAGLLGYLAGDFQIIALCACMVGALVGFLRYNTHPAIVFLGDTGSQFLGFMVGIAMVALTRGVEHYSPVLALYLIGIPMLDMAVVMAERLMDGRPLFKPDRKHLHHKLLRMGFKHHQAVVIEYAAQLGMILTGWSLRQYPDYVLLYVYVAIMSVAAAMLLFFRREERLPHLRQKDVGPGPSLPEDGKVAAAVAVSREMLARVAWYALLVTVAIFYLLSPLLLRPIATDVGVYSLAFAVALVAIRCIKHDLLKLSVKLAAYFSATYTIMIIEHGRLTLWHPSAPDIYLPLFVAIGLCYCCYLVCTFEQMPIVTMDYLLLGVVILTLFLPEPYRSQYRVHAIAARVLLMFLTIELIAYKLKDKGDLMMLGLLPSLGLYFVMAFWPWVI